MPSSDTQFKPGQIPNPGGRPKGLGRTAREVVGDDGRALVEFWSAVMRNPKAALSSRLEASRLLAERGFGKAPAFEPVKEGDPLGLDDVDRSLGKLEDELAARREAAAARAPAVRAVAGNGTPGAAAATG